MITITRGRGRSFIIKLKSKKTGEPADLTLLKAANIKFAKDTGSPLSLTLGAGIEIYGNALLGKLKVTLEETDTPNLKEFSAKTLEVDHEFGALPAPNPANELDTTYIIQAYNVKKSAYE